MILRNILRTDRPGTSTQIGWSSLSMFHKCPYLWAMMELLPHPKGGVGIRTYESRAPFIGSRFHEASAAWWAHAATTDQWDPAIGLAALEAGAKAAEANCRSLEDAAKWKAEAIDLWARYTAECGPDGPDPDARRLRPALADGKPLVEYAFDVDLGWNGYYATTRLDLVGWDPLLSPSPTTKGRLLVVEHKTHDVSLRQAELAGYELDPQISLEWMAVENAFGAEVEQFQVVANIVWKRAKGEKVALHDRTKEGALCRSWVPLRRDRIDLEKCRIDLVRRLKSMTELTEEYRGLVASGTPEVEAIRMVFDGTPPKSHCSSHFGRCPLYDACYRRGQIRSWLAGTEPRFMGQRAVVEESIE